MNKCYFVPVNNHLRWSCTSVRFSNRTNFIFFFLWPWVLIPFWQSRNFFCSLHIPKQESWLQSMAQGMGSSKLSGPGPHLLCSLDLCMLPEAWLLVVIVFLPGQPLFLFSRIRKLQLLDQSITMGTRLYSHVTIYFRIPHWFPIILRTKPKLLTTANWNVITCLLHISLALSLMEAPLFYHPDIANHLCEFLWLPQLCLACHRR